MSAPTHDALAMTNAEREAQMTPESFNRMQQARRDHELRVRFGRNILISNRQWLKLKANIAVEYPFREETAP